MDGPQGISTQKAYTTLTGQNVLVVAAWRLPFPSWPRCFCRLFLQMPQLLTRSAIYKQVERASQCEATQSRCTRQNPILPILHGWRSRSKTKTMRKQRASKRASLLSKSRCRAAARAHAQQARAYKKKKTRPAEETHAINRDPDHEAEETQKGQLKQAHKTTKGISLTSR